MRVLETVHLRAVCSTCNNNNHDDDNSNNNDSKMTIGRRTNGFSRGTFEYNTLGSDSVGQEREHKRPAQGRHERRTRGLGTFKSKGDI